LIPVNINDVTLQERVLEEEEEEEEEEESEY
jgi:hypothetical protein